MKKVKFIRHSFLTPPFDNYDNLTFSQLCDLAIHRVKPSINKNSLELLKQNYDLTELEIYDLILASSAPRTLQTAQLIQSVVNTKIPLKTSKNLDELYFDPEILTTEEKFRQNGMKEIRVAIFTALINHSEGVEELNQIKQRIEKLAQELVKTSEMSIICVTHAFYMRFLELYFVDKQTDFSQLSLEKLMQVTRYPYLEGFEIILD